MLRGCRGFATMAALGASLLSAASSASGRSRPSLADALSAHPSPRDLAANPQLLARLRGSAHGYFRFINVPFSQAVCERFADLMPTVPVVNLHGDAHVEQYAVTSLGRGLTDFDDSSTGPFVIDIMRFGVSLRLAADARGWRHQDGAILDAFLRGYRAALRDPDHVPPEPAIVARLRARFTGDHALRLREAEPLMAAAAETSALLREAGREYADEPPRPSTRPPPDLLQHQEIRRPPHGHRQRPRPEVPGPGRGAHGLGRRRRLDRGQGSEGHLDDRLRDRAAGRRPDPGGPLADCEPALRLRGLPACRWDDVLAPRVARRLRRGYDRGAALAGAARRGGRRRRGTDGKRRAALSSGRIGGFPPGGDSGRRSIDTRAGFERRFKPLRMPRPRRGSASGGRRFPEHATTDSRKPCDSTPSS